MANKLLIVALDGGTFDLIRPWAEAGLLPHLQRLMAGGVAQDLLSTYPPLTGPAWGSFMTGKSPGAHGVLEFFGREPGTYRQKLNNRLSLDGHSLWHWLSAGGLRVGAMGLPLAYPPEALPNGFIITGLLTPPHSRDFTYPPQLLAELERELGSYRLRHDEKYRKADPKPFIKEQFDILENNARAAHYLMTHKEWDCFMVHFLGTDRVQHEFWHLLDEKHPDHDPEEVARLGNVIQRFYQAVDEKLGALLALVDDQTNVLIMSDHGFGPIYSFINFNTWLLQQKLIRLKRTPGTALRYLLFRLGFNYSTLGHWVLKLGFGRQAKEMGRARREDLQRRLFLSLEDVDWSRTSVFSMGNFGQLYFNVKGREPEGFVEPGAAYQALLDEVTARLRSMVDPDSGEPVIGQIFRKEEVYSGPYVDHAPDLMFFTRNLEYKAMGLSDFSSPKVFEPVYGTTGHHRTEGIMIWHGPDIVPGATLPASPAIYDLAPTILYLMGQPVPREMDGKVLLDLISPAFRQAHPLTYAAAPSSQDGQADEVYSAEQEAQVMDMLRDLGYVT